MAALPTGTVTFLFTDIEGSTRLWEQHPEAMRAALPRHDALLTAIIEQHDGVAVKRQGEGDSVFAVFARPTAAVAAGCSLQQALLAEPWPAETPLRVRVALHTGEAELREGDYYGPAVNRCARLRAAAHGGQILLSAATQELVQDHLPSGVSLRGLGRHRLRDLQRAEQVFQLMHPDLPAEFPPLRSLELLPNNLPQQVTSFVGREQEITEVKQLLEMGACPGGGRLLTITGAGGTGKTRLALQVAADLLPEYEDGVWVVELAPLTDPALLPQAAATVLGISERPGQPRLQTVVEALKPKRLLLVLDNCEHLLAACASLADALLRACPGMRLLATSREGLNIAGETTYPLRPLSLPDPEHLPPELETLSQYEAVRLFIDRAVAVQPAFAVTNQNAPAVAQVCHRLDGIPLALELAAARVRALPVEKLNERLDDRFRLLTGGSRTAVPRQQTLQALIDWSYDLLSEPERAMLRRLSVFAGGWTLEAAEAVCTGDEIEEREVLDRLTSLVEKSLVIYDEPEGGRYRFLETVRQYAQDRLLESGEGEAVRGRHLDFVLRLAEEAEPHLTRPEQVAWLDRLEVEHDNFRAALTWANSRDDRFEAAARLAGAVWWFWVVRTYHAEGSRWLDLLLSKNSAVAPAVRAKILNGAGYLARLQFRCDRAAALCGEALALWQQVGDERGMAWALCTVAFCAQDPDAESLHEESLRLWRKVGDAWGIGYILHQWGARLYFGRGDCERAKPLLLEALSRFRTLQDPRNIAFALGVLAMVTADQGDRGAARGYAEEALSLYRQIKDRRHLLWFLMWFAEREHDPDVRRACSAEALPLARQLGDTTQMALALGEMGRCEEALGLIEALGDKAAMANALWRLGWAVQRQGDFPRAEAFYRESLHLAPEGEKSWAVARCLEGLAEVAADLEKPERAARLFGAAEEVREAIGSTVLPANRAGYERALAAARSALGEAPFAAAWAEGAAMLLEQAIRVALEGGV